MSRDSDIYDLVIQIDNQLTEKYTGDELYHKAERIIQEHNYDLAHEEIREIPSNYKDLDMEQSHEEIIAQFTDKETTYNVKFILNKGKEDLDENAVDLVGNPTDFTELEKLK